MPTILANGINIYYEISGSGEPIVIIGGLSADITMLKRMIPDLSQKYKVIAFDNRGAGRTDKPNIPYSIEMMSDDTLGLIHALGISRANILGISMGGRIALNLAIEHPDVVEKLILVSTGPTVSKGNGRRIVWFLIEIERRLGSILKKYRQPQYAYAHQLRASRSYDTTDRLGEIKTPTLIVHGKSDRLAPYKLAEEMHSRISNSSLVTLKGGHLSFLFRNKEFVESVERFLESYIS